VIRECDTKLDLDETRVCQRLAADGSLPAVFVPGRIVLRTLYRFNGAILAIVLGISWGLVATLRPERLVALTWEDGVFEWAGAVAFLGASVVFLVGLLGSRADDASVLVRMARNLPLLGFSLLFFVAFGEEISWGQRVLGIQTPTVFSELNRQGEINIHNLELFQGREKTGERKSGLAAWLNVDRLFTVFCLIWLLALPLAAKLNGRIGHWLGRFRVPLAPVWVGAVFLGNYLLSKVFEYGADRALAHSVVEVKECTSAFVVLAAAIAITSARRLASPLDSQAT
jgi:hypothetical protein